MRIGLAAVMRLSVRLVQFRQLVGGCSQVRLGCVAVFSFEGLTSVGEGSADLVDYVIPFTLKSYFLCIAAVLQVI